MHRRFAFLALVVLFAPVASGSSPTPPFELTLDGTGTPAVGATVDVQARFVSRSEDADLLLRIQVPSGLTIVGDPDWVLRVRPGGTYEHTWSVRVDQPGLWAVQVAVPDPQRAPSMWSSASGSDVLACCLRLWAAPDTGAWVAPGAAALPGPMVDAALTATRGDGDRFTALYVVRPLAPWLDHASLVATVWSPGGANETRSPPSQPVELFVQGDAEGSSGFTIQAQTAAELRFVRASGEPVVERVELDCRAYRMDMDWKGALPGGGAIACAEDVWYSPAPGLLVALLALGAPLVMARRRRLG